MKIRELLDGGRVTLSFEVFPPKADADFEPIREAVGAISALRPDFMSVTYGASGGTSKNTVRIASYLQNGCGTTALAHLSCVSSTRQEVAGMLGELKANHIENILALRGDIPEQGAFPLPGNYQYAYQLIEDIRKTAPDVCIGAACYPEGHVECGSKEQDILYLKQKVDAGAQHLVSQLFFDNDDFYRFVERCRIAGINVPIEAGIMPVLSQASIQRMVSMCGASMPRKLTRILARYGDHPQAMREAGMAYAIDQIADLIASGVDGVHLYTMNNPAVARQISDSVASIRTV